MFLKTQKARKGGGTQKLKRAGKQERAKIEKGRQAKRQN